MARLSAWVKKHLSTSSRARRSKFQLPFMSTPRRCITPTSFDAPTSLLFKLPCEIREIILLMVIDSPSRTLHVDLVYQEEGWQWRGAVCRTFRHPSCPVRFHRAPIYHDNCLRELYDYNRKWRSKYRLGIMGFLLSCRQGYTEGIHIIYAASCINIPSRPLLLHLQQLLPKNRLRSITSLQIVVSADRISHDSGRSSYHLDHLEPILDNIRKLHDHLRSFYLCIMVYSRNDEIIDSPTLPVIDAFQRVMRLRDMKLELPHETWVELIYPRDEFQHPREALTTERYERSYWRTLDGGEPKVQNRSNERYPYPPLRLPICQGDNENIESEGYWLLEGDTGPPIF